ncbi:MAG: hypothetical protein WKF66_15105 [Pedobacter sp.]
MNKLLLSLLLAGFSISSSFAQDASVVEKRAQNVFVEIGGQGLLFTANYDTRFFKQRNGLGGRAGIGYISIDDENVTTVPIALNYLLGKGKHFFEIGLGATFIGSSEGTSILFDDDSEGTVLGTMSFNYRLQPVDSGFSLRAGFNPIFNSRDFIPYFAGLSLGYTF